MKKKAQLGVGVAVGILAMVIALILIVVVYSKFVGKQLVAHHKSNLLMHNPNIG
jgi:hypothetical protein